MKTPSELLDTNDLEVRPNLGQAYFSRECPFAWMNRGARKYYCFVADGCHPIHLYEQEIYQFKHILNVAEVVNHFQAPFNLLAG